MEIKRGAGLARVSTAIRGEVLTPQEVDVLSWEEASLGSGFLRENRYAAILARRDDPSKRVYSTVDVGPTRVSIDIPLRDHTSEEILRQQAYETTFFGEIDPERLQVFATADATTEILMAFLNRQAAGVPVEEVTTWFHSTFGVNLHDRYADFFISSHGGKRPDGYSHSATIQNLSQPRARENLPVQLAIDFVQGAQRSIRHLSIKPLPINAYLQVLQSTLKFLPRDWQ